MVWFKIVHTYKIYHRTKFRGFALAGASFASTSEVWTLAILECLRARDYPQRHNLPTEFHKNLLIGSQVIGLRDTQTEWWSHKPHFVLQGKEVKKLLPPEYTQIPSWCRTLLVTVTGWYRTKRPMQLQPFSDLLCSVSEFQAVPIYTPEFPVLIAAETSSSEVGWNWARNGV
jgi:hypothetical protein